MDRSEVREVGTPWPDYPNSRLILGCSCPKKVNLASSRVGVPNLRDLTPDDLRWSCCNNNRNEVHNKYNVLESS